MLICKRPKVVAVKLYCFEVFERKLQGLRYQSSSKGTSRWRINVYKDVYSREMWYLILLKVIKYKCDNLNSCVDNEARLISNQQYSLQAPEMMSFFNLLYFCKLD